MTLPLGRIELNQKVLQKVVGQCWPTAIRQAEVLSVKCMLERSMDDSSLYARLSQITGNWNAPMEGKRVFDDSRAKAAVSTIRYVFDRGGRPIVIAHLDRPKGKPEPTRPRRALAEALSRSWSPCAIRKGLLS